MSEANWNKSEALNPLARVAMETLGCLCALEDADALPLRSFALPVCTGFGEAHDAARRILLETQYRGLTALALRSGRETVVGFPCVGLARPFTDAGLSYIGLGAPTIVDAAGRLWKGSRAGFFPADATNPASILRGLESARGELCILTAGLFPTLTDPELDPLCDALGQALRAHGGVWLTLDAEFPRAFMAILKALCGDRYMDVLLRSNDMRQWRTAGQFDNALVIDPRWDYERLLDRAVARLARRGLAVARIPMAPKTLAMRSVPETHPARDAILQSLAGQCWWQITASAPAGARQAVVRATGLRIVSRREGDMLRMKLSGRLDTLSSEAFLNDFTARSEGLQAVEIDCAALDYLSSAGLRSLFQILNVCPMTLLNINEVVGDVLEKTGFDTLVQIRNGGMDHV